jgi:hypothetical protein
VPGIDPDLVRDRRQHLSVGPFIEGLFEAAAGQTPAALRWFFCYKQLVNGCGPHVYAALF